MLKLQIEADGHVSDARVLSGPRELRGAALTAVLQWHYSPKAMTLPATTQTTIEFKLPKEGNSQTPKIALPESGHFTIKSIEIRNLSASAFDELLQRLPVHSGDSIDAAGLQSLVEDVHAYDDDLQVSVSPDRSNQLQISIAPAGTQEEPAQATEPKKIRVGGMVQQTKLMVQTHPIYPSEAKSKGIQGSVVLEATIGRDGKVEDVHVLSGEPILAAAALDAVRTWQYSTTLLNGDPVEVVTNINVNFTLSR